ncbi:uncharacterized protein LOC121378485 [Gigantopelta aegis]|uniref:uncharacterized protein LOC121378485 n=1 Tax=Gigantopelta aegis TaxID=1735272 RepID=UPI001B889CA9|nr:uncharacterized protein LOC121378485 [Gigantopelta aegis]
MEIVPCDTTRNNHQSELENIKMNNAGEEEAIISDVEGQGETTSTAESSTELSVEFDLHGDKFKQCGTGNTSNDCVTSGCGNDEDSVNVSQIVESSAQTQTETKSALCSLVLTDVVTQSVVESDVRSDATLSEVKTSPVSKTDVYLHQTPHSDSAIPRDCMDDTKIQFVDDSNGCSNETKTLSVCKTDASLNATSEGIAKEPSNCVSELKTSPVCMTDMSAPEGCVEKSNTCNNEEKVGHIEMHLSATPGDVGEDPSEVKTLCIGEVHRSLDAPSERPAAKPSDRVDESEMSSVQKTDVCLDSAPGVVTEPRDCAGEVETEQTMAVICVDNAVTMEMMPPQHSMCHSMKYRGGSDSSSDSTSDETDLSENEDGSSKKRSPSESTKTPRFTAPSLEDIRTRGELFPEDLPAIGELKISVDESVQMVPVGKVTSSVRVLVVIEPDKELPVLDEDTVLFTKDRKPFGQIFEVFGPVASPFYSVRFNSAEEIETKGIQPGDVVYYAPTVEQFTHYVFVERLKKIKGSDASWENNNEPPEWYEEYSDDENEKHTSRTRKHSGEKADESMDCLPGAIKPVRPGKRKPNRSEKKSASRETKGPGKRAHDGHKPLTSWPPSISDKHGYRALPPAPPRPFRPFGQQNIYSPKPYVSPSNSNNSSIPRQAAPSGQFQGRFAPPEQSAPRPPFSPFGQQNAFTPRPFVSPSNFNNSNAQQQAPPSNQFQGRFPPPGPPLRPGMQGFPPPQHCPGVEMNQHRQQQQQSNSFQSTESRPQPPGFHPVDFRPPVQHPGCPAMENRPHPHHQPPSPFEMNQQRDGPQSMENHLHPNQQSPRPFEINQQRDGPQFMGQNWSNGQNNSPGCPGFGDSGSRNPPPQWNQPPDVSSQNHQNEFQSHDSWRNQFPQAPYQNQPHGVVDSRLMQNWNDGGPNFERQSAFGGRPRFEAGPINSNGQMSSQFQNGRPPYTGNNH